MATDRIRQTGGGAGITYSGWSGRRTWPWIAAASSSRRRCQRTESGGGGDAMADESDILGWGDERN